MTGLDLAAIRQRAEQATPGPWWLQTWPYPDQADNACVAGGDGTCIGGYDADYPLNDARFIAAARTDIPALLDRLDLLGKKLEVQKEISRQNFEEWKKVADEEEARADQLSARLAAVRELHVKDGDSCETCSHPGAITPWPCPTIQALDGDQ